MNLFVCCCFLFPWFTVCENDLEQTICDNIPSYGLLETSMLQEIEED